MMSLNIQNSRNREPFNPTPSDDMGDNAFQQMLNCDHSGSRKVLMDIARNAERTYGLNLLWYKQDFDPKKTHPIYGDQNSPYKGPYKIRALIDITSDTSLLPHA